MENILAACDMCLKLNHVDLADRRKARPQCGTCRSILPVSTNVVEASGEGLRNLVRSARSPVLIDFWAPWCGPCKTMDPVFEEASNRLGERFHFLRVNIDKDSLCTRHFRVRSIPSLVLIHYGVETLRQLGVMSLETLLFWLENSEKYEVAARA